jgi:hypothetical protein
VALSAVDVEYLAVDGVSALSAALLLLTSPMLQLFSNGLVSLPLLAFLLLLTLLLLLAYRLLPDVPAVAWHTCCAVAAFPSVVNTLV